MNPARKVSRQAKTRDEMLVWHPDVHAHFNEELYFFLMAVKPFDARKFEEQLRVVMREFEVPKFCAYQIYGSFDTLVRVWLPAGYGRQFAERVRRTIENVQEILAFRVDDIPFLWDTADPPSANDVKRLDKEHVDRIQRDDPDKDLVDDYVARRLLRRVEPLAKNGGNRKQPELKAFLCLTPQNTSLTSEKKRQIRAGLIKKLHADLGNAARVTVHEGMGFGWVLIKLVVNQFYKIGQLVRDTAESYNADGIATSTFIVLWADCPEGDSVSGLALKASKAVDRKVQVFIPELYDTEPAGAPVREIEQFLLERVLRERFLPNTKGVDTLREWSAPDLEALRNYFVACLNADDGAAFTALYPRVGEFEAQLRRLLPPATVKSAYPGGLKTLGERLAGKQFGALALGDALRAACLVIESARP